MENWMQEPNCSSFVCIFTEHSVLHSWAGNYSPNLAGKKLRKEGSVFVSLPATDSIFVWHSFILSFNLATLCLFYRICLLLEFPM